MCKLGIRLLNWGSMFLDVYRLFVSENQGTCALLQWGPHRRDIPILVAYLQRWLVDLVVQHWLKHTSVQLLDSRWEIQETSCQTDWSLLLFQTRLKSSLSQTTDFNIARIFCPLMVTKAWDISILWKSQWWSSQLTWPCMVSCTTHILQETINDWNVYTNADSCTRTGLLCAKCIIMQNLLKIPNLASDSPEAIQ